MIKILGLIVAAHAAISVGAAMVVFIAGLLTGPASLVFGGVAAGCAFILFFIERLSATDFLALTWQTMRIEIVCIRLDGGPAYA